MKRRTILLGLTLFPLLGAHCDARRRRPNALLLPGSRLMTQRDRTKLAAYVADFQTVLKTPHCATGSWPWPSLWIQLRRSPNLRGTGFSSAAAKLKSASSADDFKAAATQFDAVAVQAPWYTYAYFKRRFRG